MSIPVSIDPLGTLGAELPYIQPDMTSATTWRNKPSFGMTVEGRAQHGEAYCAFDGQRSPDDFPKWADYNGGKADPPRLSYSALMTFKHPLKIVGVQFCNASNASPRKYDFYGVEDDGTEVLLWHTQRGYGTFTDNMRCENPRYFKRYKFVQSFNKGWGGWAQVYWVKLDAYYRPSDL